MRRGNPPRDRRAALFQVAAMFAVLVCVLIVLVHAGGGDREIAKRLTEPVPIVGIP